MRLTVHFVSSDALRQPPVHFVGAPRRFPQPKLLNFSLRESVEAREKLLCQFGPLLNRQRQGFSTDCFGFHERNSSTDRRLRALTPCSPTRVSASGAAKVRQPLDGTVDHFLSFHQLSAISRRSSPQKISSPTAKVGDPNTPSLLASSVSASRRFPIATESALARTATGSCPIPAITLAGTGAGWSSRVRQVASFAALCRPAIKPW